METSAMHSASIESIFHLDASGPDDLVLEALALARRVNDRLKDRTTTAVHRAKKQSADEDSNHPGELVC